MARVGRPSVPHATATGKVMLAFESTGSAGGTGSAGAAGSAGAGPLTAYTERTITDPDALAVELAAVRERGYAEAVGEREPDLGAVAAPVFGRGGQLTAILGIQGPASRLPAAARKALRAPLLEAAAELSSLLGGDGGSQLQG
jgi:DNA-binding IclR family transcriptional regulator